jgi:hypothetical protein
VTQRAVPLARQVSRKLTAESLLLQGNILFPGLYAWLTTVAYPSTQRGAPGLARASALAALVTVVVGPLLAVERPRAGRWVGLVGFVALCLACWLILGPLISVQRLEPMRACLGSLAWALFAFGWGDVRKVGSVPEDDPNVIPGPPLTPRSALARGSAVVFGLGLLGASVPLVLAWREVRPHHALFAHAVALVWSVALVTSAARIASLRGQHEGPSAPRVRLRAALRPLLLLAIGLTVGVAWAGLR